MSYYNYNPFYIFRKKTDIYFMKPGGLILYMRSGTPKGKGKGKGTKAGTLSMSKIFGLLRSNKKLYIKLAKNGKLPDDIKQNLQTIIDNSKNNDYIKEAADILKTNEVINEMRQCILLYKAHEIDKALELYSKLLNDEFIYLNSELASKMNELLDAVTSNPNITSKPAVESVSKPASEPTPEPAKPAETPEPAVKDMIANAKPTPEPASEPVGEDGIITAKFASEPTPEPAKPAETPEPAVKDMIANAKPTPEPASEPVEPAKTTESKKRFEGPFIITENPDGSIRIDSKEENEFHLNLRKGDKYEIDEEGNIKIYNNNIFIKSWYYDKDFNEISKKNFGKTTKPASKSNNPDVKDMTANAKPTPKSWGDYGKWSWQYNLKNGNFLWNPKSPWFWINNLTNEVARIANNVDNDTYSNGLLNAVFNADTDAPIGIVLFTNPYRLGLTSLLKASEWLSGAKMSPNINPEKNNARKDSVLIGVDTENIVNNLKSLSEEKYPNNSTSINDNKNKQ